MKQILSFYLLSSLVFSLVGASAYILQRNFESYKQQKKIYIDLNQSNFKETSKEFYNNIETELPSISITAMPLKGLKAMYILENEKDSINQVKSLFRKSIIDNPYLMFSEGNLSQIYYAERKYDSAYYYARKSFNGLPRNAIHFAMLGKLYANKKHIDSIVYFYEKINKSSGKGIDRVYMSSMTNFYNVLDDSLKQRVLKHVIDIKKRNATQKELQYLTDQIIVGKEEFEKALSLEEEGKILLENKKFNEGILKYKEALAIRKNNYPYLQTIGLAYYNLAQFKNAIEYLGIIENNGIPLDPISLYAKGISYFNIGKQKTGCGYLLKASKFNQENAKIAYQKYCSQNL